MELRELGTYTLKDIRRPERIYQLDTDGTHRTFPPLRHAVPAGAPAGVRRLLRPRTRRRDAAILAGGLLLVAAGVGAGIHQLTTRASGRVLPAAPNTLAAIDPKTDRMIADIPVGNTPTDVAVGAGSVWVLNSNEQTLSRIDPRTTSVLRTIPAGTTASDIAVGAGVVWVAGTTNHLVRIDPDAPLAVRTFALPGERNPFLNSVASTVAATTNAVWATTTGAVWRIEPAPSRRFAVIQQRCCAPIAIGLGSIWVAGLFGVDRLDAVSGAHQAHIKLSFRASDLAVGAGGVWASDENADRVWRIEPKLNAVGATIQVGAHPAAIAVGLGSVWVASGDGTVSRIDPNTDRVTTIAVGGAPSGIAVAAGRVWVSID